MGDAPAPALNGPAEGLAAPEAAPPEAAGDAPVVVPVAPPLSPTVRVRTETLDRFLSAVGEVILSSSQLRTGVARYASDPEVADGVLDRVGDDGDVCGRHGQQLVGLVADILPPAFAQLASDLVVVQDA